MARFNQKYGGKNSLANAARIVGHVWTGEAHRALADALACRSVWLHLEGADLESDELLSSHPIQFEEATISVDSNQSKALDLVGRILFWSNSWDGSEGFDPSFVRSVERQIESGRRISAKQVEALWNIVDRWKVP